MANQGDTGGEKSFQPTPKKLADARKRGEVAKSLDVSAAAAYLGLLVGLIAFGAGAAQQAGGALALFLGRADQLEGRMLGPGGSGLSAALIGEAALGLAPLFLLPFAAALAVLIAQGAFVIAPEKLMPKASRINPVAIAGNKFGPTGLFEFAKNILKISVIGTVLWLYLTARIDEIIGVLRAPPTLIGPEMMRLGTGLVAAIAAITCAIAAFDYLWQRFDHARKLRMSFQEIKDETREAEGDPHQKAQRRRRAEEIAKNQMMAEVRQADVVIVNPTHFAVALKWTREPGSAPHCVAKGVDAMARAIRDAAAEAGIPVHSDPPTARALHALVEIGQEVPPEHYRAVAASIRFAEAMRARARAGWQGAP